MQKQSSSLWTFAALAGLALPLALAMPGPAHAHPHVWIENRSDLVLDEAGRIVAINVEWKFDEMYSLVAVEGLDANSDGIYQADEIQSLAQENIEALKEYDYFVYAKVNGEKISYGEVTEYGNLFSGGVLTLYFRVPLASPVDPTKAEFTFSIYDPSYYIAIDLVEPDPVEIVGTLAPSCRIEIGKSVAEAQDFQYSEEFWAQEANEGMGAMFAQPVKLRCAES